jgi:hypothetical protein
MRELTTQELEVVVGSTGVGALWAATLPVRAVAGAGMFGWAIGSAVYRTYDAEILDGIEYVMR